LVFKFIFEKNFIDILMKLLSYFQKHKHRLVVQTDDNTKEEKADVTEEDLVVLVHETKDSHRKILNFLERRRVCITYILVTLFLGVANYVHTSSNEYCSYDAFKCLITVIRAKMRIWLLKSFLSACIFMTLITLSIHGKLHRLIAVITLINVIYLVFFYDNRLTEHVYSQAFAMLLGVYMIILFLLYVFVILLALSFTRIPRLTITLILTLTIFTMVNLSRNLEHSCDHWAEGVDKIQIDNSVSCKIRIPTSCALDMMEGVLNFARNDCRRSKANLELLANFYPDAPIVGFPRVEHLDPLERVTEYYSSNVLKRMVSLNSIEDEAAKDLEIFIDKRDTTNIKVITRVKRNETLVHEKAKLNKVEGLAKNVLVVFFDGLSRARMHSKLKKTMNWFSRRQKPGMQNMEAFEFFKYHSNAPSTWYNELLVHIGSVPDFSLPPPEKPALTLVNEFHLNGYITGRFSGYCEQSNLDTLEFTLPYYSSLPFDHEGNPLACDPHYTPPINPNGLYDGPYSFMRRCMYGKDMFDYQFEYGNKFFDAYSQEKKLFWLDFLEPHEPTQEVVKNVDEALANFLEGLEKKDHLKDTVILFWSDHGRHYDFFPYDLNAYNLYQERALPIFLLMLPRQIISQYEQVLQENTQKLVSGYQIHSLLKGIPNGKTSPYLKSSILSTLPGLTCQDIPLFYQDCYCE
jgi:hypothetical protein